MVPMFPYLVVRHQVSDLPTVVVNGREQIVGPVSEDDFVARVQSAA